MLTKSPCPSCGAETKPWVSPETKNTSRELTHAENCEIVQREVAVRCDGAPRFALKV